MNPKVNDVEKLPFHVKENTTISKSVYDIQKCQSYYIKAGRVTVYVVVILYKLTSTLDF